MIEVNIQAGPKILEEQAIEVPLDRLGRYAGSILERRCWIDRRDCPGRTIFDPVTSEAMSGFTSSGSPSRRSRLS